MKGILNYHLFEGVVIFLGGGLVPVNGGCNVLRISWRFQQVSWGKLHGFGKNAGDSC
jgi:hypothetical protein